MKRFIIDGYVCGGANGAPGVETRTTNSGSTVISFRVNSATYNRQTQQSTPQYFQCEYWPRKSDWRPQLIREGALLLMSGDLAVDTWQDKATGQNRSQVKLRVHEIGQISEPRQRGAAPQQAYQQAAPQVPAYQRQAPAHRPPQPPAQAPACRPPQAPAPQQAYQQAAPQEVYDEDIPF